jgi:hypothetical protein
MRTIMILAGIITGYSMAGLDAFAGFNLVANGDFETGDFSNWNYTSQDGFSFVGTGFAESGSYAAFFGDLQEDGGGSISQSLATTAGTSYVLSFWFAGNGDTPSGFSAIVGGNTVYQVTNPSYDGSYANYTFNFTASGNSTLLEFDAYDNVSYINLDNISVTSVSVPEPSSMIPLAIGMGTLAGCTAYRGKRSIQSG